MAKGAIRNEVDGAAAAGTGSTSGQDAGAYGAICPEPMALYASPPTA